MDREVFVFIDLRDPPIPVGRLSTRIRRERESASFEYDGGWLKQAERFALEPALPLTPGPFHTVPDNALFGTIGGSAPDRWGRGPMRRSEHHHPEREARTEKVVATNARHDLPPRPKPAFSALSAAREMRSAALAST